MSVKATLYLDIDGVVNFFGSRTQHNKFARLGYLRRGSAPAEGNLYRMDWSAELLKRLSEIDGLEIALLSTWNTNSEALFTALQWSADRVLGDVAGYDSDQRKFEVLKADQAETQLPFIWADDTATFLGAGFTDSMAAHEIIAPMPNIGITATELAVIEDFVNSL